MSHTVVVPSALERASTFSSSGAHSMPARIEVSANKCEVNDALVMQTKSLQ